MVDQIGDGPASLGVRRISPALYVSPRVFLLKGNPEFAPDRLAVKSLMLTHNTIVPASEDAGKPARFLALSKQAFE